MLRIWGKWSGLPVPFPLLGHMVDTAAVALSAWGLFAPQVRFHATAVLAPGEEQTARARFAVLAALHDCGKATREFTGQVWSRDRDAFAPHRAALVAAGLPMAAPVRRPVLSGWSGLWLRHEAVTGLVLHDQTSLPAWARRVVMGHHGRYQPTGPDQPITPELEQLRARAGDPAWVAVQRELLARVVATVGRATGVELSLDDWPVELPSRQVAFVVALTGLVCVCDWVASDEAFVLSAPRGLLESGDLDAYLRARCLAAERALDGVLAGSSTPTGDFAELFNGKSPRGAAQRWAARQRHGPGLSIVMVPMGEGKTEVALYMHAADASVTPGLPAGDGLFFGLPTMATADAIFARVRQFWDGIAGLGRLAHSQAVLNDFYAPGEWQPLCDGDEGDAVARDGLRPSDWCRGRHRGLWAMVTVGTCDQVLAAALDHKFLPVRLAALAGKHVVLDEIHTYDPYQHMLLCRLLGWLGAFGCRVTLLSATLPRARVVQLAAAWSWGWQQRPTRASVDTALAGLPKELPYPSVVAVRDTAVCEPLRAWRQFQLGVRSHLVPVGDTSVEATAAVVQQLRAEQPHARIGLIVNTVDRAIAMFTALADHEPGATVLLHSRMTAAQRRQATSDLHTLVGPAAPAGAALMVATQVAEASLDLDLDVLVTDLAPMASLLQRTGRLWRHSINTGGGWEHPEKLSYRTGNPVVHILAPVNTDGQLASGAAALPYTAAELRQTWSHSSCLALGARTEFQIPAEVQPAIDAAHVSLADLTEQAAQESPQTREVLEHLAGELAKVGAATRAGHEVSEIARRWRPGPDHDPWGRAEPDWSALTAPRLWDEDEGAVTRLQEREQAQVLLYDTSGQSRWAWHGDPATLTRDTDRDTLLAALGATVPVSGRLATQLRTAAAPHLPEQWERTAPPLLRGLTPMPLSALDGIAALDDTRGLVKESTV
ncbi:CRISPR-associated helicase Cas3' [Amycolatopsis lurida]